MKTADALMTLANGDLPRFGLTAEHCIEGIGQPMFTHKLEVPISGDLVGQIRKSAVGKNYPTAQIQLI